MSSLFRASRPEGGDGSGGKILRGRRPATSASPYHPPEKPPPPPPPHGQSGSGTWLSGLVSGAGKLISSVFRSASTSPASSSSYFSSDEDISRSSDQYVDTDVSSKEPDEMKQIEKKSEPIKDCIGRSLAIISEIETKHAIEQLLMQETFARDECNKLTKIIQSRVIDFPYAEVGEDGIQKQILDRSTGNAIAFPGALKSLNQARKIPATISYSSSRLNAFSPGSSAQQALTPDLCNSAVMEAKKWLEEKKSASSSNFDFECSPRTLNSNVLQYDFEGSPVDMAKSYMRSLPPCKSLSLSSIGFKTTPSTGVDLYKDEVPYATANYSSPSSKVLKRNSLAFRSWDTLDEIRRVRMKSTENASETFKFQQIDPSARYSEHEACKISSAAEEHTDDDSSYLQAKESIDASADLSAELCVKDLRSVGVLRLPNDKAVEANLPLITCNTTSINLASDAEEAVNAVQSIHSSLTTFPSKLDSRTESEPQSCDPAFLILDKSQNLEEPSQAMEQPGSIFVPCDSLILASASVHYDGDPLNDLLKVEAKANPSVEIKSAQSDTDAVTNLNDVDTSSIHISCEVEDNSLHQKLVSGVKEIHSIADARSQNGNAEIQNEANALTNRVSANGSSAGLNSNPYVGSKEELNPTNSNNGEKAAGISEGTRVLSTEATTAVPALKTNSSRGRSRKVTARKAEPQPATSDTQRRKAVPRPRKGRGK